MSFDQRPISFSAACRFVSEEHRHNHPPAGWLFGTALYDGETLVGVGMTGRPTSRMLDDGLTIEITRVTTLGGANACSFLYGALCRAAESLGYLLAVTYALESESGSSLRAANFVKVASVAPRSWNCPSRPRYDTDLFGTPVTPQVPKDRWHRVLRPRRLHSSSQQAVASGIS